MFQEPSYEELKAQLENLKSRNRTQEILDCAGVMFIEMDTKGIITLVNKKACEIFGYAESEMLGKNWFENFLPERIKNEILPLSKKLLTGEIESAEYYENPILTKKGEERIIYWHNAILRDDRGNITGHLSSGEDITNRKIANAKIKESEEKFRAIADHTIDWEYWIDTENSFLYNSPSCKRITGYDPVEFYNDKELLTKIIHPGDKKIFSEHIHAADNQGNIIPIDIRIINKEEQVQWISHVCQPVLDKNGNSLGLRGSNRLITDYKKVELHWKMLSNIVEQSPATIVITDLAGNIEYVNQAFTRITGYSSEEAIGQNPRILNSGKNDPQIFIDLWETISNGETWIGDFINTRKNGEEYYERAIISPTHNEDGQIVNYFAIKEDITAQRLAEQELKRSEQELQNTNMMKDKHFSIIAHDLRNPFNAILGFSDLLLKNNASYDIAKREQLIRFISESSKRAYLLLENLLEWSRASTGKVVFNPDKIILEEIISEGISHTEIMAQNKEIHLSYKLTEDIILYADRSMLSTVLRNLISNAIKFTPKLGSIEVYAHQDQNAVIISVKDTGVGISEERLNALFHNENYDTTEGTNNEAGSGLGLVLCKDLVEKHGGRIWAESQEGFGSIFSFSIPKSKE
ncbi:MAG: PAS domain S-box protein [Bacteroidales bacterium]|nr:PAS domain S-box protein [Bacteroidales bacterium]